jgi:hypothetical protein
VTFAQTASLPEALVRSNDRSLARRLACLLGAAFGFAFTLLTFWPGQMNVDALIQLQQARSFVFNDHHPPIMSLLWSGFDQAFPGPAGMLVFHNLMFWTGLGIIVYLLKPPFVWAALAIPAVGLLPPVFTALGTIWKDVGMGSALLLAYALFFYAHRRSSRLALVLGLMPLFYGLSVRHNALPGILPLALWAGLLIGRLLARERARIVRLSWLLGLLLACLFALLNSSLTRALVGSNRTYPLQLIILHDLTALSLKTGVVYPPEELVLRDGPITLEKLACIYTPDKAGAVFQGNHDHCAFRFKKVSGDRRMSLLVNIWLDAVLTHLPEYLEHRLAVFRAQFAIDPRRVCYPLEVGIAPNDLGLDFYRSPLYNWVLEKSAVAAYDTPLFRGWIYLATSGILVLVAVRTCRADRLPGLVLASSSLLYGLSYLMVSIGCDFRFHWYLVITSPVLALVIFADRARGEGRASNRQRHR